jgi:hypothetical protein
MDGGKVTDPVLELALRHAREQRDEITLWLAAQVLMTDDVALADAALQDRLLVLQDRIENMMRARYGLPDRDAEPSAGEPANLTGRSSAPR